MKENVRLYEYKIAVTEVTFVLQYLPESMKSKIPKKFLNFLKENSISNYNPKFDFSYGLCNVNLTKKAKAILAVIYRNYICTEEEKSILIKYCIKTKNYIKKK